MPDLAVALARWRVPLGFVVGAIALWLSRPTPFTVAAGLGVAIAGEVLRVWAAGHLVKGREVTRSGPYRRMRHPLYLGSTIMGIGLAIACARVSVALLIAGYLGTTLVAAIRTEEAWMRSAFGDRYDRAPERPAEGTIRRFSLERAMANREHRTVAGLVIVAALLAIKAVMRS